MILFIFFSIPIRIQLCYNSLVRKHIRLRSLTKYDHIGITMETNQKHILQKTSIVLVCALICTALWGSAFPCIKIGYQLFHIASSDTASQMLFAGIRFFLAGVLTILIGSIQQKKLLLPTKTSLHKILILCLFQTVIQYLLFYIGLAHTTAVKGSILGGTTVLFSLLLTCLVFRQERMTSFKLLGCIIGFVGIIVVNLTGSGVDIQFTLTGEGFMILSSLSSAFSAVFLKKFADENPVMLSGYQFFVGGAILAVIGKAMGGTLSGFSFAPILLLLYMALISAIAYSLWALLLKYNPVSRITVFGFMIQVFGVILSAIFVRENNSFGVQTIVALIFVCSGIYLVNRNTTKKYY